MRTRFKHTHFTTNTHQTQTQRPTKDSHLNRKIMIEPSYGVRHAFGVRCDAWGGCGYATIMSSMLA